MKYWHLVIMAACTFSLSAMKTNGTSTKKPTPKTSSPILQRVAPPIAGFLLSMYYLNGGNPSHPRDSWEYLPHHWTDGCREDDPYVRHRSKK